MQLRMKQLYMHLLAVLRIRRLRTHLRIKPSCFAHCFIAYCFIAHCFIAQSFGIRERDNTR